MDSSTATPAPERRSQRRVPLRLPIEFRRSDDTTGGMVRSLTSNVSPAGVYFEVDWAPLRGGDRLDMEFTLPAAEGVFPYTGRASCRAEVVRVDRLGADEETGFARFGVAARFLERLRISY